MLMGVIILDNRLFLSYISTIALNDFLRGGGG